MIDPPKGWDVDMVPEEEANGYRAYLSRDGVVWVKLWIRADDLDQARDRAHGICHALDRIVPSS